MTMEIVAKGGQVVLVDNADYESMAAYKWHLSTDGYAKRNERTGLDRPKQRPVRMHRQIMGLLSGDGGFVDHINGNRLDNRRENLRVCTQAENCRNRRAQRNSTSGFKGVCWRKDRQDWAAHIAVDKKKRHLGFFQTKELAYAAYCAAADALHGEFANYGIEST